VEGWLPGDFAVVHSSAVTGKAVHVLQELSGNGSEDYEHVIIGLPGGLIVEAMPGGAQSVPFHYSPDAVFWSTHRLPAGLEPTEAERMAICASARRAAGDKIGYSWLDYLALAAHDWHVPAPGLREFIAASGHQICSQLADWCYDMAGVHLLSGVWTGYCRPCDLATLIGAPPPATLGRPAAGERSAA
jgi:hypothetical protein